MMTQSVALLKSQAIRFQLTSLLDLLLIIVFAQYMDVQRSKQVTQIQTQHQLASTRQRLEEEYQHQVSLLNKTHEELMQQNQWLREAKQQAIAMAEAASLRQQRSEGLLKNMLKLNADVLDEALSPAESTETLDRAIETTEMLQSMDGTELLRFFAGYAELLKRAEIWTLHVSDRGDIELQSSSPNAPTQGFRLEAATQIEREQEFLDRLRSVYSQLPQPKGLVVILVSYNPRATAGNFQPVLDGMPAAIEWLGTDSGGQTRFEYAVIGAVTDKERDLAVQQESSADSKQSR
ncbi:hypothetical protein [Novipirellula artificiosorum]|uniref:Uncharacterized protein n=1 Tax=Novipirellula artificiosorum TaxID=2528016 RepID=A0A5C6E4G1_9BACT|nr:hypothetical protein [Novipirellula artificiosorum]TWU42316.1 hypothetical protein Poly41_06120 [Novipirellula artificiosorum]